MKEEEKLYFFYYFFLRHKKYQVYFLGCITCRRFLKKKNTKGKGLVFVGVVRIKRVKSELLFRLWYKEEKKREKGGVILV